MYRSSSALVMIVLSNPILLSIFLALVVSVVSLRFILKSLRFCLEITLKAGLILLVVHFGQVLLHHHNFSTPTTENVQFYGETAGVRQPPYTTWRADAGAVPQHTPHWLGQASAAWAWASSTFAATVRGQTDGDTAERPSDGQGLGSHATDSPAGAAATAAATRGPLSLLSHTLCDGTLRHGWLCNILDPHSGDGRADGTETTATASTPTGSSDGSTSSSSGGGSGRGRTGNHSSRRDAPVAQANPADDKAHRKH